jgi:hypothetical protein
VNRRRTGTDRDVGTAIDAASDDAAASPGPTRRPCRAGTLAGLALPAGDELIQPAFPVRGAHHPLWDRTDALGTVYALSAAGAMAWRRARRRSSPPAGYWLPPQRMLACQAASPNTPGCLAQARSNASRAQSRHVPQDEAIKVCSISVSNERVPSCTACAMSRSETLWQIQTIMVRSQTDKNPVRSLHQTGMLLNKIAAPATKRSGRIAHL